VDASRATNESVESLRCWFGQSRDLPKDYERQLTGSVGYSAANGSPGVTSSSGQWYGRLTQETDNKATPTVPRVW
jgi:hypothetical protein